MQERYCHLFDIVPGQHIHLGKGIHTVWKQHLKDYQVTTGVKTSPCDLLIETDISESLNLLKKDGLDKLLTWNGSALLQVSKIPRRHFRLIKKIITRCINQNSDSGFKVRLTNHAGSLHYFALSIQPCFETPNNISSLPCKVKDGELHISRQAEDSPGSIAVFVTKRDTPFSHLLIDLTDKSITTTSSSIIRIMFRERGTLIVEFNDTDNNLYISRASLASKNDKNIVKNYKVIESLHANSALPQNAKQLIPAPISLSANSSVESKKQGQLAWKIVRDMPELESVIISQAWDFSFSLSAGTCRKLKLDAEGYDAVIGRDLKYIQYYCSNDDKVSRMLVLIDEYLHKQLSNKEVYVAVSHGDFGYGNILCDDKIGNLAGVFDWDTSRDVELPGVDFFNLLIQKYRAHSRMDESYTDALHWLESEETLPTKIRSQLHDRFDVSYEQLKLYSIISVLHLMGRDFQFHEAGSLRPEERDTLILIVSSI